MSNHQPSANAPLDPGLNSGSRQSVLVVDDEAGIRQVLSLVLESGGYQVSCAADGVEGFRILTERSFDLVITDMLMPGSDGFELLAAVKKIRPATRIIVVSGGGMSGVDYYLKMAKKLGAHAVLEKPFDSATLLSTVASVLAEAD
ncbi:MAG: response regulator [Verrucomicrobia bacterium]|nr:response regulator [Verrucomicrobiota bacterium]